jgi:hypothetical protein
VVNPAMEILAVTAIIIGFLIIALLKRRPLYGELEENRQWWSQMESSRRSRKFIEMDPDQFQALCVELIGRLGLEIVDRQAGERGEVLLVARSDRPIIGGDYLISLYLEDRGGGPVPIEKLLNLRDAIRAHGALKGIFITNTYFPSDTSVDQEGAPIVAINGIDLGSLMGEYALI